MNSAFVTSESVFCSGDRQLVQRFRRPDIAHHFEFSAGSVFRGFEKNRNSITSWPIKKAKKFMRMVEKARKSVH